ncbi:hypothetical protein C7M84_016110 [Penaeus vannamei]|uniref:Ig-like domain-containing protein n=1 Tax=Penaeus vannamei TaxID=6689 RepID=A0A423SNY6_PENVA|nr:hypothetical protein C7M84_016110 [Penaeus vannamei]
MEVETLQVASGQNFTVQEERTGKIKCISRFGNPPAEIKWFIAHSEMKVSAALYRRGNCQEPLGPGKILFFLSTKGRVAAPCAVENARPPRGRTSEGNHELERQRVNRLRCEVHKAAGERSSRSNSRRRRHGRPAGAGGERKAVIGCTGPVRWPLQQNQSEEELPAEEYEQTNVTEAERSKTWMAVSSLEHTYHKEDHGLPLRCVAVHQAYRTKSESVEVILDVQRPHRDPGGPPSGDIEEGVDDVTLRCLVDANPAAPRWCGASWARRTCSASSRGEVQPRVPQTLRHVHLRGRNSVGASDPISVKIDVKYGPRVLQVGPAPVMTVALHNHTLLECLAEGNPPPKYTWRQTVPDTQEVLVRGTNSTLLLEDVTYEHQGQYECVVANTIKGEEIEEISMPITLEVVGAPQVLRYTVERNVQVEKGEDALIQVMFCSDPRPLRTTWEWGSLQLEAGNDKGRYVAENLAQDTRQDCYAARLRVQHADVADARDYILNVENDKGKDRYAVGLKVNGGCPVRRPDILTPLSSTCRQAPTTACPSFSRTRVHVMNADPLYLTLSHTAAEIKFAFSPRRCRSPPPPPLETSALCPRQPRLSPCPGLPPALRSHRSKGRLAGLGVLPL